MRTEESKYEKVIKKAIDKIKFLTDKVAELSKENNGVSIIGYNCRFPGGANNSEQFWKLLSDGYDAVEEVPRDRFSIKEYYDKEKGKKGKTYAKEAAFLNCDIKKFDYTHFEMNKTEAISEDPQHRLLYEVIWEALQNAGLDIEQLRGSKTGVFLGIDSKEYVMSEFLSDDPSKITPYSLMGNAGHTAAGRVAYFYDFKGPTIVYNTACSSALVALEAAVNSLEKKQCDLAIVGGVSLMLSANSFIGLSQINAIAQDGRCKAFDQSADGYGRGEGCGVIILKRAREAQEDNNHIEAHVRSVCIQQDGKSNGFFAPNGLSEYQVMQQALEKSGLSVNDIDYIETHGTGTVLGDSIEGQAIAKVYEKKKKPILIGSVKTNIGHLEAAAGMASMIKVLLSMKHGKIPASIHFHNPNTELDYRKIHVVNELVEWKSQGGKRAAGISSFGISGTLVHAIFEQNVENKKKIERESENHLITLSAMTEKTLENEIADFYDFCENSNESIRDICYATNRSRSSLPVRFAVKVSEKDQLKVLLKDRSIFEKCMNNKAVAIRKNICVLADAWDEKEYKLLEFAKCFTVFSDCLDKCVKIFSDLIGLDFRNLKPREYRAEWLFSIQISMVELWKSIGVTFDEYIGLGAGKYAEKYLSGNDSLRKIASEIVDNNGILLDEKNTVVEKSQNLYFIIGQNEKVYQLSSSVCSFTGGENERESFLDAVEKLYLLGYRLRWEALYNSENSSWITLPNYPFQRKECWRDIISFPRKGNESKRDNKNIENEEYAMENVLTDSNDDIKSDICTFVSKISGYSTDEISVNKPFYAFGFDSFSFVKLANEINCRYKMDIPIEKFFSELDTISKVCEYIMDNYSGERKDEYLLEKTDNIDIAEANSLNSKTNEISILSEIYAQRQELNEQRKLLLDIIDALKGEKSNTETVACREYPMSMIQERLYSQIGMSKEDPYDLVGAYYINSFIDIKKAEECFLKILRRHKILSTGMYLHQGKFFQKEELVKEVHLKVLTQPKDIELDRFITESLVKFRLDCPPLAEMLMIHTSENRNLLIFHFHHTVADGYSTNIFAKEFMQLYSEMKLPVLQKQYNDYVAWEKSYYGSEGYLREEKFWLNGIEDTLFTLPLPYDYMKKADNSLHGNSITRLMSEGAVKSLRKICADYGVTMFMAMYSVVSILIRAITRENNFALAVPVSSRNKGGFNDNIGMFTNILPYHVEINEDETYQCFIKRVKEFCLNAYSNVNYSFHELVNKIGNSAKHILNTVFVYENVNSRIQSTDQFNIEQYPYNPPVEEFELIFEFFEHNNGLEVCMRYQTDLFKEETIRCLIDRMELIIRQLIKDSDIQIQNIEVTTEEEKNLILEQFNDTDLEYDAEKTVVDLFEEQVKTNPDSIAVEYENKTITYSQLNNMANNVAEVLNNKGIGRNDFVGIVAKRGIEMIAAIIGVMKSGAAYIPIAPDYPESRIEYILKDSNAKAVLVTESGINTETYRISIEEAIQNNNETSNPKNKINVKDYAYCIYTSGTTGRPKGVIICHSGIVALNAYLKNLYQVNIHDNVLQFANYVFDASVWEITMALFNGAKLVIVSENTIANMDQFNAYVKNKKITITLLPPQFFLQTNIKGLRVLTTGGSAANREVVEKAKDNQRYINAYGPTENTVLATHWEYKDEFYDVVPIGKPISNTKIYILDQDKLCGIGIPGELCITGKGVAVGYLNRKDLTSEKFVKNPYGEGMMYRSGDLAKWTSSGEIQFLGRIDEQVKIRGYRIEMGEVENALLGVDKVREAAVKVINDGEYAELVAYYTSDERLDVKYVKEALKKILPEYMIPAYLMQIDSIPINKSGKVDVKKLPEVQLIRDEEYIGPRNELEKKLCRLFSIVLDQEHIGVRDNFFELGGHSLRATRLVNLIAENTGYNIPQKYIFETPTVELLAQRISGNAVKENDLPKAQEADYYPMSSAQKRIYVVCEMEKDNILYNMPQMLRMSGKVNVGRIEFALQEMINRHEVLRTEFLMIDGKPVQRICKNVKADFTYLEDDITTEENLINGFVRPFDLQKPPLVRMKLVRRANDYLFMLDIHHIVGDGMSIVNFIDEFSQIYNGNHLPSLRRQYKDYSEWMRKRDISDQRRYWLDELSGDIPVLDFPSDYSRPKERSEKGDSVTKTVEETLVKQINKLTKQTETTDYMVFMAALMILLSIYSRQNDILIGSPISGRTHVCTEKMLGMFTNTLVMRGKPEASKTVREFLNEVKSSCLKAYENQEFPYEQLVMELGNGREMSHNSLFDVMLAFQNNETIHMPLEGIEISVCERQTNIARFDMVFNVDVQEETFKIELVYCADLYMKSTMDYLLDHYLNVLREMCMKLDKPIQEICLITTQEKESILDMSTASKWTVPDNQTISDLLREQVNHNKSGIAITYDKEELTYQEFDIETDKVAVKLRSMGIGRNDCVAILAKKSIDMVIGIYGIIKAGAAYVPIDPNYPEDRISFILGDCNSKAILTYQTEIDTRIPVLDLAKRFEWNEATHNLELINKSSDLAYIIYTSGTTGMPKGVMVEHKGVVNLKYFFNKVYGINEKDTILQFANYVFDASVWEMTMALLNGATLAVIPEVRIQSVTEMEEYCEQKGVSVVTLPPNYYVLTEKLSPRIVITAGSEATKEIVRKAKASGSKYFNAYGPTETTVCATQWEYDDSISIPDYVPIGKPISNMSVFVMNDMRLCPIGVPGELCVAGIGLARGYLNQEQLTNEKFANSPYGDEKIYRTGDLSVLKPDGNIVYMGRIDEQVKIRGYRIELGEVENALRMIAGIRDCAVITQKDADNVAVIVAYYVSDDTKENTTIREKLKKILPGYMIPTYFQKIDSIPVNQSGKLDKKKLPGLNISNFEEYIEPETEIQKVLCNVLEEILNVEKIGIRDNFFELGGDSIKAIRVVTKMREQGYELKTKDILSQYIVEQICNSVKMHKAYSCDQGEVNGKVEFTPMIQEFFDWKLRKPEHFNQSILVRFENDCVSDFYEAVIEVVKHHDILRAKYHDGELYIRSISDGRLIDYNVYYFDKYEINDDVVTDSMTFLQSGIDLENGPLVRCGCYVLKDAFYFLIIIHHLVVDSVSWQIIMEDLNTCLEQIKQGKKITLPLKTASYKEWSLALQNYRTTSNCRLQLGYWQRVIDEIPYGNINVEKRNEADGYGMLESVFTKEETDDFLFDIHKTYHTESMDILLSSLVKSVHDWLNMSMVSVYLESHGRHAIDRELDIDRTVGWFTNCFPAVFEYDDELEELIVLTKERYRSIPDHGIGYGLLKDELKELMIPSLSINYLGKIESNDSFDGELLNFTGQNIAHENEFMTDISLLGRIVNEQLHIFFYYSNKKYVKKQIEEFANTFASSLRQIIDYCLSKNESVKTKSDIACSENINSKEFDEISNIFNM